MTSEIRTNSITSRAGMSTVTMTDSGPMFSGITTFVDNSTFSVGTGGTIHAPATNVMALGTNNIDAIKIDSSGNVNVTGILTASSISGEISGDLTIADSIVHAGDTHTKIRFPANDQFTVETAGTERLKLDRSADQSHLYVIGDDTGMGARVFLQNKNTTSGAMSSVECLDQGGQSVSGVKFHINNHSNNEGYMTMFTRPSGGTTTERLRIQSDGTIIFVNKLTNSSSFTSHNTNFYGGDVNTGGVRIELAHSTTTVSGNTASGAFPHHLNLTNYSGSGSADNRMVTIGFDIPTTSSHANGVIAYQATAAGAGDFSFHTETGNAIGERLRITSDGRIGIGAMADSSARLGINGSSTAELSNSSGLYNQTNPCFLQIKNSTDDITDPECGIILQPRNSQNGAVALFAKRTGSYTSDLIYRTRTGANTSLERFRITPSGKVVLSNSDGIQLSAQTSTLYTVDGSLSYYATNNAVYLNGAGASGWMRLSAAGTANNRTAINLYGHSYASSDQIDFRTNSLERFRITSGGEVILGPDANVSPAATLHVRTQGDVSSTIGSAPANIMIEATYTGNWASGEAGAEILFKKDGDITGAIRAEHDRGGGDHSYEDAGLAFYTAPASENPTATRKFRVLSTGNADLTGSLTEGSDIRLKTDVVSICLLYTSPSPRDS